MLKQKIAWSRKVESGFRKDHAQQKLEPHPDAIGMEQAPEQSNRKGQKK
ncbi:hypothetical protein [Mesorhizobium sp.]|nr:hypothetical protein [Mesorhizobium sp.]